MRRGGSAVLVGGLAAAGVALAACGGADELSAPMTRDLRVPPVVTGPVDIDDFDLGFLVPRDARVRRAWKPAPDQVLVEWTAARRPSLYAEDLRGPWGLVLWTRFRTYGFASRWRSYPLPVTTQVGTGQPNIWIALGDVTSDGRRDILVAQYAGNHGCGPHRVVAAIARRPRVIYRNELCQSTLASHRGLLKVSMPDHAPGDSVCCPSFFRVTLWRWSGRRLVAISTQRIPQRP